MPWLELTRRQCREVDRIAAEDYGVPGLVLMENAAHGLYSVAVSHFVGPAKAHGYTVLCGKGNNGGDGLAVARLLLCARNDVRVLLTDSPESFTGDAAVQLRILQNMGITLRPAEQFFAGSAPVHGVLIDAVYGTGFRPPSRLDFASLNARLPRPDAYVIAVDVPSGMETDTGEVKDGNAIRADITVTMMTGKRGFSADGALRYTGRVWSVGLGIPFEIAMRASVSPE